MKDNIDRYMTIEFNHQKKLRVIMENYTDKLDSEISTIKKAFYKLAFTQGLIKGLVSWLSLIGNLSILYNCIIHSYQSLFKNGDTYELLTWFGLLFAGIIITPKVNEMSAKAEDFFLRIYATAINSLYAITLAITLYRTMFLKQAIIIINTSTLLSKPLESVTFLKGSHELVAIISVYLASWLIASHINRKTPKHYLRYTNLPFFIIGSICVIYSAFYLNISPKNFFNGSIDDGVIKLTISTIAVILFTTMIIRKTFHEDKELNV